MARREHSVRKTCTHAGCLEFVIYRYPTLRDLKLSGEYLREWTCLRHTNPEQWLGLDRLMIETSSVSKRSVNGSDSRFWGSFGFLHGLGFKAMADDFPEGTKITITARIELPKEPTP